MDFLKEVGSFTPSDLIDRLTEIAQAHGQVMEDTEVVRTYVLAQGSARLSVSRYPITFDHVVTVIYGDKGSQRELMLWKHPDGKIAMTLS
jgi:hypothetical protein